MVLTLALLVLPSMGFTLDPDKVLSQYVVETWDIDDGLPILSVKDIAQTHDGYLWIATGNGLVRFDGVRFVVFNDINSKGIVDRDVIALNVDKEGNLWMGTGGGLCRLNRGKFTSFTMKDGLSNNEITDLVSDSKGILWIGTREGLSRFYRGRFTSYTTKDGLLNNAIFALCIDHQEDLWIGTPGGLSRFNGKKFTNYTERDGLPGNNVYALTEDRQGALWIGTARGGVCRFSRGKFTTFNSKHGLSTNKITSIFEDRRGNLWVGTARGFNRFKDGEFKSFSQPPHLENLHVTRIYEDREGGLWIGSDSSGLTRLQDGKLTAYSTEEGLSGNIVSSIFQDRRGHLWIGTKNNGLNCFIDGKFKHYSTSNGLSSLRVTSLWEDRRGHLWIGTNNGLNCRKNGKIDVYTKDHGMSYNFVNSVIEDRAGNLWVGTYNGLNRFEEGKFTVFTVEDGLAGNHVRVMHQDREGVLWIGTVKGLTAYKNGKFTAYTQKDGLSYDIVISFHEDLEGILWIGTMGGGLNRWKNGTFTAYTTRNGLVDDSIYAIFEDDRGKLWMSSNKGIFHINKVKFDELDNGTIDSLPCTSYGKPDGMRVSECNDSGWQDRDGKLWFATLKGVVVIDPAALNLNRHPPSVIIEKVLVDNEPIPIGRNTRLGAGKENFEFHYTAASLPVPKRVKFKYRLEGLDNGWRDAGTRRIAYYNSIPPGDHRFQVMACNNDGVWNETGASLSFYLAPYFHQTSWFYFLSVLLVGVMGYLGYRFRVRQLKEREKKLGLLVESRTRDLNQRNSELEHTKELVEAKNIQLQKQTVQLKEQAEKLQETDQAKSRFFANISHEFRTPLTLIMGPIEQMIAACPDTDRERKRKLTLMLRNAQRLLRLINQLLELSKLDSGKMRLHTAKTDIISFLKGIIASFQLLARHLELDLLFHFKNMENNETGFGNWLITIDPQKMEVIMTNLLSNAVKFTPPGGKVEVVVTRNPSAQSHFPKGWMEISVSDTGPGLTGEQSSYIFDRFYQADNTFEHHKKGSGIGLALCKELVELHSGTIVARNCNGGGSEFVIRLPLGVAPSPSAAKDEVYITGALANDRPGIFHANLTPEIYTPEVILENEENRNEVGNRAKTRWEPESGAPVNEKNIILVVEDSADLRHYIRGALETGYSIVEAGDGREGIQKAREIIPDLIISDVMMPVTDGCELCSRLKSDIDTSHIPIILLTAKAAEENILQGLESGADDYITKPFNTKILIARIKNLIDLRSHLQQTIHREMILQPVKASLSRLDQRFLDDMHDVIDRNLSDWEFNVEALRKNLRMSRATLYRKVQALSGLTPNQFIQSYRLKRAAELLKRSSRTVQDVAFEVGFASPSYFSKCFKEKFQRQPSEYQAANQQ